MRAQYLSAQSDKVRNIGVKSQRSAPRHDDSDDVVIAVLIRVCAVSAAKGKK
jgi:hypothetical protein